MEQGFGDFSVQQIVFAGERLGIMSVISGDAESVELLAKEDFSYALSPEEEPQILLSKPDFVYAPVVKGADAGFAWVRIDGTAVGKIPLRYGKTVERIPEEEISFWEKLFGGDRK